MGDDTTEFYSTTSEMSSTLETTSEDPEYSSLASSSVAFTTEFFTSFFETTTDKIEYKANEIEFEHEDRKHAEFAQFFSPTDYILFAVMLGLSALIGVYFGFISKKKQNNTAEYLLGGKKMNFFPIAASLIAR
jgi:hypothetical protein